MRVLDLFSGIGGFSLGLERAGMRTIQFVELDSFCQYVLREHWPAVRCHDDIRTFHAPLGFADVICGGFPCQDISIAGFGAGLAGARSGLWTEFHRLIGEVRPRYAIVENVSALLHRGLGEVLGDLAEIGYDAEWHCIPASAVGAPHRRDRIWIVAYPARDVRAEQTKGWAQRKRTRASGESESVADAHREGKLQPRRPVIEVWRWLGDGGEMGDANGEGLEKRETRIRKARASYGGFARDHIAVSGQWSVEPDVGRVAHGVPSRVDRLRALGNAVVPQIPEIIGRAIMRMEACQ